MTPASQQQCRITSAGTRLIQSFLNLPSTQNSVPVSNMVCNAQRVLCELTTSAQIFRGDCGSDSVLELVLDSLVWLVSEPWWLEESTCLGSSAYLELHLTSLPSISHTFIAHTQHTRYCLQTIARAYNMTDLPAHPRQLQQQGFVRKVLQRSGWSGLRLSLQGNCGFI